MLTKYFIFFLLLNLSIATSTYAQKRHGSKSDSTQTIYNDSSKCLQKLITYKKGIAVHTEEYEYYKNCTTKSYKSYYKNGIKHQICNYDTNGFPTYCESYWENGNRQSESTFQGKFSTSLKKYSKKGKVTKYDVYPVYTQPAGKKN